MRDDDATVSLWALFLGAFFQVTAVAMNTRVIAAGNIVAAFWTGGLVSLIWFTNTHRAAHATGRVAQVVYASGAAAGTAVGMVIGGWLT